MKKLYAIILIILVFSSYSIFNSKYADSSINSRSYTLNTNITTLQGPGSEVPLNLDRKYKYGRRGLAILALLHKNFPVEDAYEILRESDRPTFALLYGKNAFGADPINYYKLMSMFLEEGRSVHIEIYTLCGACRPPRIRTMNLASFCKNMNVRELEDSFVNNRKTRLKYRKWLKGIKSEFVDPYPEMTFTLTISLEDNDGGKWEVVKQKARILKSVFKDSSNVVFARNNVGDIPYGYSNFKREIHTIDIRHLKLVSKGDIVSFDGDYFNFPGQDLTREDWYKGSHVSSFKETKKIIRKARKKGLDVYVWRHEFQGLDTVKRQHPSKRNYRIVKKEYLKQLMNLK